MKNKPNRNYRITPDLMSGATHITLSGNKLKTATEVAMREMAEEACQIHDYRKGRPRGLTATELKWFGRNALPGRSGYGIAPLTGRHFNGLICDDLISDYGTTGKPAVMDKESLRASIKYFNEMMGNNKALCGHYKPQLLSTMAVDPAVKNKNKKENKMEIKIQQVENGFVIDVGCKTFVSTSWKEAAKALGEYFEDPAAAEKKYCRKEK